MNRQVWVTVAVLPIQDAWLCLVFFIYVKSVVFLNCSFQTSSVLLSEILPHCSWMVPLLGSINKSPECSWNCAQESSAPLLFGTYCSLSWNSKPCFSWTLFLSHLLVWLVQYVAACVTMVCRCCERYVKDQSVYNLITFRPATPHPYPHPLQQCSGV